MTDANYHIIGHQPKAPSGTALQLYVWERSKSMSVYVCSFVDRVRKKDLQVRDATELAVLSDVTAA